MTSEITRNIECAMWNEKSASHICFSIKRTVEALDGLPPAKIHCSVLAEEAVKAAVKDYYDKNGIEYDHEKFQSVDCAHCHE